MRAAKDALASISQQVVGAWAMVQSSAAISAEQQKIEAFSSSVNQYLQRGSAESQMTDAQQEAHQRAFESVISAEHQKAESFLNSHSPRGHRKWSVAGWLSILPKFFVRFYPLRKK